MNTIGTALHVRIYIGESDKWRHKPLYMAIVEMLRQEDCARATVTRGLAGFGAARRIHAASEANRLIKAHTETDERLHFIDLTEAIMGQDGRPDRSLFRLDRLHPSQKGYARWVSVIKPIRAADLGPAAGPGPA